MMRTGLKANHRFIKNNRGMVSADFIFSLVIAFGLSIVLFAMTFTFSMAEVAQYIVFSSSRAYVAGHVDMDRQEELGRAKFNELLKDSELAPLLSTPSNPWFKLANLELRGNRDNNFNGDYAGYSNRIPFVGARAEFTAQLLSLKLPLLGQTNPDGEGMTAKLTAFLIREPTQKECWEQVKARYKAIIKLENRFTSGPVNISGGTDTYIPMEDNGC